MARLLALVLALTSTAFVAEAQGALDTYDVVWDSPSADGLGSMPLGNGDVSVNAWIDPSGELVFYVGKTDAWDEFGRLLKVGRVRIGLDPPPSLEPFEQRLVLREGQMHVGMGEGEERVELLVYVDASYPAVEVHVRSRRPRSATLTLDPWRTEPAPVPRAEISDLFEDRSKPESLRAEVVVPPDVILDLPGDRVGWVHHNATSPFFDEVVRIQGLAAHFEDRSDPLLFRTTGAIARGRGATRVDERRLRGPKALKQRFTLVVHTEHPSTPEEWLAGAERVDAEYENPEDRAEGRYQDHVIWWRDFWSRSWIDVTASEEEGSEDALTVSRAYALQRFVTACAGRGRYPIKFNGSIFNVAHPGQFGDADYRRWGPGYWWQNTRLPYFAMPAAGDLDLMEPLFRMYATEQLPLHELRARQYTGHGGALIPECVYFWGGSFSAAYGWTPYADRGEDKLQDSGWHKREWVAGLELVHLMLDRHEHAPDAAFLAETLLPFADSVLAFFDEHYETNDEGKLVMHPSQSLETWWDCTNPMPEIAGLRAVLARLMALPASSASEARRDAWAALAAKVPDLPTREADGVRMLAPAGEYAVEQNVESPELYAVFPFRLVSFERENAALGLEALRRRKHKGHSGWRQDDLFLTHLGLAEEAKAALIQRARNKHSGSRFPAFFGPNYDWIPDQTHGGVLMRTLQTMLLQTDGDRLFLLPAWPSGWDARFRLHAPRETVLEGEVRGGELVALEVSPPARAADVVVVGR
jgi:hypothetical protein